MLSGILVNVEDAGGRNGALATNLRALRADVGMSTVELARRASISRATLAQLEAGGGNPTLETLYALANALGASLAQLIAEPAPVLAPEVVRVGTGPRVLGSAVEAWLLATVGPAHAGVEIYDFHLHAGDAQQSAAHPPGTREHLHLSAGRALVGPAEAPVAIGAGDFVSFAADVPHVYRRLGRAEVRGVLVISRGQR
jgi:transcriptional regulator with XRE-family HTH domain